MPANPAADDKAQFNVYLPRELIRRAKYASIDAGQSLSRLVEEALTAHLERLGRDKEGQDKEGQDKEGQVRS